MNVIEQWLTERALKTGEKPRLILLASTPGGLRVAGWYGYIETQKEGWTEHWYETDVLPTLEEVLTDMSLEILAEREFGA